MSAAILGLLLATATPDPLLVFSGNAVINDEVYRAVLDLPEEARPTASNARLVRVRLLDFLRRAGYVLAQVKTRVEGSTIRVEIDEGRVDKVVVLGKGAFQTLRLKLDLSIPYNVYNRPVLDRQLKDLAAKYNFQTYRLELVPVERESHLGPQIDLPRIQDLELVPPERPYELHILLSDRGFEDGLTPELSFNSVEGVGLGGRHRLNSSLLEGDRMETRLRLAATLRETIDETKTRPVLSRALAEARWHTPPLIGKGFRSFLWLRSDLLNRQRPDLGIESFFYLSLDASLNAGFQFVDHLSASLGAGIENRRLFSIDRSPMVSPIVDETPTLQTRPFGVAAVDFVMNPNEVRRDRKTFLSIEARGYLRASADRPNSLRLNYTFQALRLFGWHELWLRSRGVSTHGDSLFPDEQPIGGNHLRGPFGDLFYVRRLASFGVDFRFSMVRDLFKVSVFHDAVAFGMIDRERNRTTRFFLANAFGLGLHTLLIESFQLDAYYGFGFATRHQVDHGFVLSIQQAF